MPATRRARHDRWQSLSLEWKLPLLMTCGIGAALAVLLLSTYFVLRRRAEATVRERMTHGVRSVALEVDQALDERAKQFQQIAASDAIRRLLLEARGNSVTEADREAARRVLEGIVP